MSLEVKKNEEPIKSRDREQKPTRKSSNTTKPSATDKTSQTQKRKKRSRSKSEGRRKESSVETKVGGKKDGQEDQLYEELDVKPQPQKEVSSGTRKTKKSKDKIVVSKLVTSDRPLREKSPEKKIKYSRSISQPAPPPNLQFLLPADSQPQPQLSRNLSLGATDKEKSRRSAGSSSGSAEAEVNVNNGKRRKQSEKMSLYDNDGFDHSPALARKASGDCRQQKFLSLKDQIHHQLRLAAAAASSESGTVERRGRRGSQQYLPMEEMEGANEDSDCSASDPQSPPTQIQSLSEESSGGSTSGQSSLIVPTRANTLLPVWASFITVATPGRSQTQTPTLTVNSPSPPAILMSEYQMSTQSQCRYPCQGPVSTMINLTLTKVGP